MAAIPPREEDTEQDTEAVATPSGAKRGMRVLAIMVAAIVVGVGAAVTVNKIKGWWGEGEKRRQIHKLEEMTVNLQSVEGDDYLKLEIALKLKGGKRGMVNAFRDLMRGGDVTDKIRRALVTQGDLVRDRLISILSKQTAGDLQNEQQTVILRETIREELNALLLEDDDVRTAVGSKDVPISQLYFTERWVQTR